MAYTIENARATSENANGIWVEAEDLDESTFIPHSQIDDDSEVYKRGTEGDLVISDWLARERGWT